MGDWKMTCPGCEAWTNSVGAAYRDGKPCPNCGLPWTVTSAVLQVRKSHADEKLREEYEALLVTSAKIERERDEALRRLERAARALTGEDA